MIDEYSVIDLFCGVGGLTHGFIQEGLSVVAGVDSDESCKFAYEKNNPGAKFIKDKIEVLSSTDLLNHYKNPSRKILVGCAPCQPFSTYTGKVRYEKHKKWGLLYHFSQIIEDISPEIISMENVPQLKRSQKQVYLDFLQKLEELNYHVWDELVYCPDYGIPQTRTRLVLLASKLGPISLISPTHSKDEYKKVKDVIAHLPEIKSGETCESDPLHRASELSDLNLKRIRASVPGGSWKDWDDELKLACHLKDSGKSYGSVYGRMKWDEPSPTMTTQCIGIGNGRFGHPEQDRAISLREAAIFQTFPSDYNFIDPESRFFPTIIARHIGNAVPVRLGEVIAKSIRLHLEKNERTQIQNDSQPQRVESLGVESLQ